MLFFSSAVSACVFPQDGGDTIRCGVFIAVFCVCCGYRERERERGVMDYLLRTFVRKCVSVITSSESGTE